MSMPTNNEYRTPDTVEDTTVEPRRTTSPVLLMLLAFAVTAAGLMWWTQSRHAGTETPVAALPAPVADDAANAPANERAAAADRKRAERTAATRPASVSRDARPLAGNAEPKYPASMLRAGVGGTVVVLADVDAQGNPIDVRVVERSGERDLDRAAVSAVRQWRFEPAMRNGKAIATSVKVPVDFKPI
ncbi:MULTISPECIES: energy transducer TonB [unclassified Pseudoxanthomonas]|uniref:energy transducer TonB n=1 Tax=unclassified Pseudoxanthomonas TaxID=2645906 RepID=UPI0008E437A5|nr:MULTISPECIES: energy transducer TonB [unclassified Pseudoxanthomonas]PPJ42833.1 energy transducer TonB [Pseudoxanthomonas sp. KAs_5_3]SFV26208.1 outer membrane transport energization protein TonB [Pseudoxanthomonas sp. YR558]